MSVRILTGDCRDVLRTLPEESVNCVVTSPPYWGLRDYGNGESGIGLERSMHEHIGALRGVFQEVWRVLRKDGTLWLNYGDAYSGSGKGGNPTDSPHQKQRTNQGSLSVIGQSARDQAQTKRAGDNRTPSGLKPKDLMGLPWRIAFALQDDGWWLRSDIIWAKPNPMPESVTDRPTRAHEYVFLLTKSAKYQYDAGAIKEPAVYSGLANQDESGFKDPRSFDGKHSEGYRSGGKRTDKQRGHSRRHAGFNERWDAMPKEEQCGGMRNVRSVWEIATAPFAEAHFATFPPEIAERCIKAGCPADGVVLDPFGGAGTVGLVADRLQRDAILIELNPEYAAMAERRILRDAPMFAQVSK